MINNSDSILATTSEIASMVQVHVDANNNANSNTNVNKETILEFCTRIGQLSLELSQINLRLDNASSLEEAGEINSEKSRVINEINELSAKIGELTKQMSLQESSNTNVVLDEDTVDTGDTAKEPVSLSITPITNNESNVKEEQKKEQEQEEPLKQVKFPTKVESVTFKAVIYLPKKEGKANITSMVINDTFVGSSIQDLINTLKEWLSDDSILVENMEYGVKEFTIKLQRPFKGNWSPTSIKIDIHTGNSEKGLKIKPTCDTKSGYRTIEERKEAFKKRFSEIIFMLEMLDY